MIIKFKEAYLQELYETGKTTDKKYRFQPNVAQQYQARIKALEMASKTDDLHAISSLQYEVLKGNKKGASSIYVNDKCRIELRASQVATETVVTICGIL
jgi:proteic killer suppression protein